LVAQITARPRRFSACALLFVTSRSFETLGFVFDFEGWVLPVALIIATMAATVFLGQLIPNRLFRVPCSGCGQKMREPTRIFEDVAALGTPG